MSHVEAAKLAISKLNSQRYHENSYLCKCLGFTEYDERIKDVIRARVFPNASFDGYLARLGLVPLWDYASDTIVQQLRINFVLKIAEELDAE